MSKLLRFLFLSLLLGASIFISESLVAKKSDHKNWNLDIVFYNASSEVSDSDVASEIKKWVSHAESKYERRPALKIKYSIEKMLYKDGVKLSELKFKSLAEYSKFMEKNFDTEAITKTSGHFKVLVNDDLCIGEKDGAPNCYGGYASFPHDVNPVGAKRGITMALSRADEWTFTHEFGHIFGLKHTFEPYVGLNLQCNKGYKPKGRPKGYCNSCSLGKIVYDSDGYPDECNGQSNIMDYCPAVKGKEYLNSCQQERASNQRLQYMTKDGKTNYWKLKGLKGEPICKKDSDCGDNNMYCDKGTLTVGRNQCFAKKPLGDACTRSGQCKSDRCNLGKCKEADECHEDKDCNKNGKKGVCKKGTLSLGKNYCSFIESPTCKSGWSYEERNPLNKDRCNKTVTKTAKLECKLGAFDKKDNWSGPHAKKGEDECRHKTNSKKGPKGVKCPKGYDIKKRPEGDYCEKQEIEHETPSCPAGWKYKSRKGKDECMSE